MLGKSLEIDIAPANLSYLLEEHEAHFPVIDRQLLSLDLKGFLLPLTNVEENTIVAFRMLSCTYFSSESDHVDMYLITLSAWNRISNGKVRLVGRFLGCNSEPVQDTVHMCIDRECVVISESKQRYARRRLISDAVQFPQTSDKSIPVFGTQAPPVKPREHIPDSADDFDYGLTLLVRDAAHLNKSLDVAWLRVCQIKKVRKFVLQVNVSFVAVDVVGILRKYCCYEKFERVGEFPLPLRSTEKVPKP